MMMFSTVTTKSSSLLFLVLAASASKFATADDTAASSQNSICTSDTNTFTTKVNLYAGELGYYEFEECPGLINPTIGLEVGETYTFLQHDRSNYYHPLGFAYFPDGAHDGVEELEPGIGMGADTACSSAASCPAPMYFLNGNYLGSYSNIPEVTNVTAGEEDFGLDAYEPLFFHPMPEWVGYGTFEIKLNFDDQSYDQDIFYFCHIHTMMSGRIKLLQNGNPIQPDSDLPAIPYTYDEPGEFDETCGTFGLDSFQLPHDECPERFVCDASEEVQPFSNCIDAMNCAMMAGMTTGVSSNSEVALFIHQMIPHHQNAVNMAKALLHTDKLVCDDLTDDEDPMCIMQTIMYEIINNQNKQIQDMRGVLETMGLPMTDDCEVNMNDGHDHSNEGGNTDNDTPVVEDEDDTAANRQSRGLKEMAATATGAFFGAAAHLF